MNEKKIYLFFYLEYFNIENLLYILFIHGYIFKIYKLKLKIIALVNFIHNYIVFYKKINIIMSK